MNKYIINRPFPRLKVIFNYLLSSKTLNTDLKFFKNGREAIVYGLGKSGLAKGSLILVPAFICNSFTEFIISAGYKIQYIDINEDMTLDVRKVETILRYKEIKAIIFVYYFGLNFKVEPLFSLCKKYNVKIIEDYSHVFQTKIDKIYPLIKGDFAIYSFRKILPVADGGALRLSSKIRSRTINSSNFSIRDDVIYFVSRLIEFTLRIILNINIYSLKFDSIKTCLQKLLLLKRKNNKFYSLKPRNNTSILLKVFLSNKRYLAESAKRRVINFNYLLNSMINLGLKPYIKSIDNQSLPLYFIIQDNHGGLDKWLRLNGIGAFKWPGNELPTEIKSSPTFYVNSNKLNDKLVMLPIHQDINESSYKKLLYLLKKWKLKINS